MFDPFPRSVISTGQFRVCRPLGTVCHAEPNVIGALWLVQTSRQVAGTGNVPVPA